MLQQFRPSVRHTRASYQNGWTYHRNSFTKSPSDRPIILVFRHQELLHKSDYPLQGDSDFGPIRGYISETVIAAANIVYCV